MEANASIYLRRILILKVSFDKKPWALEAIFHIGT